MSLQIAADLKPRLSPGAGVVLAGDEEFAGLVGRWREYHAPTVAAVVQVTTESDIQQTVSKPTWAQPPGIARHCLLHLPCPVC